MPAQAGIQVFGGTFVPSTPNSYVNGGVGPTRRLSIEGGQVYVWLDEVVVHEFGHTFGLSDRDLEPKYNGIMNGKKLIDEGVKSIKTADRDALEAIYKAHTMNHGW